MNSRCHSYPHHIPAEMETGKHLARATHLFETRHRLDPSYLTSLSMCSNTWSSISQNKVLNLGQAVRRSSLACCEMKKTELQKPNIVTFYIEIGLLKNCSLWKYVFFFLISYCPLFYKQLLSSQCPTYKTKHVIPGFEFKNCVFIPRISKAKIYSWVRKYLLPCKALVYLLLSTCLVIVILNFQFLIAWFLSASLSQTWTHFLNAFVFTGGEWVE